MKKIALFFVLFIFSLFIFSCSGNKKLPVEGEKEEAEKETKIPLTRALIKDYDISTKELNALQYFMGTTLILKKDLKFKSSDVKKGGKLLLKDSDTENEIEILENTMGECLKIESNKTLQIGFKEGSNDYILFGPGPDEDGTYQILIEGTQTENGPLYKYGKGTYIISEGAEAQLLVDPEKLKGKGKKETLKGRTVKTPPPSTSSKEKPKA